MPLSDFRQASGLRVHGGQEGEIYRQRGVIVVSRAPVLGFDANLFGALKIAVDALRLRINVNSVDTGQHAPNSRHESGRASDINKVVPVLEIEWKQATLQNREAVQLFNFFRQNGWHVGEGGNWPGLFLGPPRTPLNPSGYDHSTHLHVSIGRAYQPGVEEQWSYYEPEPVDCEVDDES